MSDTIEKAIQLMKPLATEHPTDWVHWITADGCNHCDEDYCSACIEQAVIDARKEYLLEQRKKPLKFRDEEFLLFDYESTGHCVSESETLAHCETCSKSLEVSLILTEQ